MEDIIHGLQPLVYILIAVVALSWTQYRKTVDKWRVDPPKMPNHLILRIVLATLFIVVFSLAYNAFVSDLRYFWVNVTGVIITQLTYLAVIIGRLKKYANGRMPKRVSKSRPKGTWQVP